MHVMNDLCSLLLLIALLAGVGSAMTNRRDDLHRWGYRIAAGTFVASDVYALAVSYPSSIKACLEVSLGALLLAALALGISWIVLPVSAFAAEHLLQPMFNRVRLAQAYAINRQKEKTRLAKNQQDHAEFERLATQREQAACEAAARAAAQAQSQKRRAPARAQSEFLYHLYSPEIESRFPRAKFDDFVAKYLSDRQPPEDVEYHADQLRALLDSHVKKAEPRSRFKSLRDLADWYREQQAHVRSADLDPEATEVLLINLEIQYEQLLRQFIQGI